MCGKYYIIEIFLTESYFMGVNVEGWKNKIDDKTLYNFDDFVNSICLLLFNWIFFLLPIM